MVHNINRLEDKIHNLIPRPRAPPRRPPPPPDITPVPPLPVAQPIQDELGGGARVGHHQQDLGPPELHVILPHVQHQQIFAHLTQHRGTGTLGLASVLLCAVLMLKMYERLENLESESWRFSRF